jgi:glycosyltransferase involved in cell wall biosynthesis
VRIAIVNLTRGGMSGGYQKYLTNIIPRMRDNNDVDKILCVTPGTVHVSSWINDQKKVQFSTGRPFSIFQHKAGRHFRQELEEFKPTVIFIPMERYLNFGNIPVVNMVRNMLPYLDQKINPPVEKLRNFVQRYVSRYSVMKSNRVIAVSQYVKEFMHEYWRIPVDKIDVVYHGNNFGDEDILEKPDVIPSQWRDDFIFTAGSIDPYRGLEDLISALRVCKAINRNINLVIAGSARPALTSYKNKLALELIKYGLTGNVVWAGQLNEAGMKWCYRSCKAFIMTSRVEACPNVALEAMGNGCLCVASDRKPMPEFFQDTASYYQAGDIEGLARIVVELLDLADEKKKEQRTKALKRGSEFSWDVCTETTLRVLKKTIRENRVFHTP